MKIFFTAVFIFVAITTIAQNRIKFSSQNYAGLLEGENGSAFQLQTINGFKYKTWFAGLGTGIDWYYRRSIPAFVSLNKDFLRKRNRNFYVSADGGINFSWKDNAYAESGYSIEKLNPGLYWAAGLGYKIGIGKNDDALLMQIGYSYKHISEKIKSRYIVYDSSEPYPTERFDYYLKRLSIKFGWSF